MAAGAADNGRRNRRRSRTHYWAAVCVSALVASAPFGAAASSASAAPPTLAANGVVMPILKCPQQGPCNGSEGIGIRSAFAPFLAYGNIRLPGEDIGEVDVDCLSSSTGKEWDEHEGGLQGGPIRAYGLIEGWSAACTATYGGPFLIFPQPQFGPVTLTAEQPLQEQRTEGETCDETEVRAGRTRLSECPAATERERQELIGTVRRSQPTLPWKSEFVEDTEPDGGAPRVWMRLI